jgi:phosphate transport system substrate-binding protein
MLKWPLAPVSQLCTTLVLLIIWPIITGSTLTTGDKAATIRIGGTGCALGGIKAVAQAFEKRNPGIRIKVLPSLGSGGGIKALFSGAVDIALSARELTDTELSQGATAIEYARTPFAFVTSERTEKVALSLNQVAAVYRGDKQRWPDGTPIRLILRPETDADMIFLRTMSPVMEKAVHHALRQEGMLIASSDQDNADLLGSIRGAFGACTIAQIESEKRHLRPLMLDGVMPSLTNLASGTYPYSKTFFAVVWHANPASQSFIKYLQSAEGRAILMRTGHLVGQMVK